MSLTNVKEGVVPKPAPKQLELDRLTLARARRGEASAFRTLVKLYERRVFAVVARITLGHGDLVEDLAQEAFLKVHRALPGFNPDGSARLSTWILTIAARTAIDATRRNRFAFEPLPPALPAEGPGLEHGAERREELKRVLEAASSLDLEHRSVLVLRAFHDLDYAEIAEALSLRVGTVKSRLARARDALRRALEDERHVERI